MSETDAQGQQHTDSTEGGDVVQGDKHVTEQPEPTEAPAESPDPAPEEGGE